TFLLDHHQNKGHPSRKHLTLIVLLIISCPRLSEFSFFYINLYILLLLSEYSYQIIFHVICSFLLLFFSNKFYLLFYDLLISFIALIIYFRYRSISFVRFDFFVL